MVTVALVNEFVSLTKKPFIVSSLVSRGKLDAFRRLSPSGFVGSLRSRSLREQFFLR